MPELPPAALERASAFLRLADARLPGLVEGLYLTGSVALGDFRPGVSDVDFVAVASQPPSGAVADALGGIHAALRAAGDRPEFDGLYLGWADLARPPGLAQRRPYHLGGLFRGEGVCFEANPVTWQVLRDHAAVVRGPDPAAVGVWTDPGVLADWTIGNLNGYWADWIDRHTAATDPSGCAAADAREAAWGALGVARLHYTLTTGAIVSKDAAGAYAARVFPDRWRPLLAACREARRGADPAPMSASQFSDALAFMRTVIEDANRLVVRQ